MGRTTIAEPVSIAGIGVHSGRPARIVVTPARAETGIVFRLARRRPIPLRWLAAPRASDGTVDVPATFAHVAATRLATVLAGPGSTPVRTVEHLMSALYGLGIDDAIVIAEGPEVPILDGSAAPFAEALAGAGVVPGEGERRRIVVRRPVSVESADAWARLAPADDPGLALSVAIDFPDAAIGRQAIEIALSPESFRREIAPARTFGRVGELKRLNRLGFGRGASLENAIGVDGDGILNPEGLRFPDEFVRHKTLDVVGDLALAGAPIAGRFASFKGGHRLNHAVLTALFADPANYAIVRDPA